MFVSSSLWVSSFLPILISVASISGGVDAPVSQIELTQAWEVENVMVLASVREDVEGLIYKVALLEGEIVDTR
jgi:hypothetical protein